MLLIIDAAVLVFLVQALGDDTVEFLTAIIVALFASVGTAVMGSLIGDLLAALLGAAGVGVAVSALCGIEIKRSFLIGGLFLVIHIMASFGLRMLLG